LRSGARTEYTVTDAAAGTVTLQVDLKQAGDSAILPLAFVGPKDAPGPNPRIASVETAPLSVKAGAPAEEERPQAQVLLPRRTGGVALDLELRWPAGTPDPHAELELPGSGFQVVTYYDQKSGTLRAAAFGRKPLPPRTKVVLTADSLPGEIGAITIDEEPVTGARLVAPDAWRRSVAPRIRRLPRWDVRSRLRR
jgi:hypothetical protein